MREVPLYEAKNRLSALIQDVIDTGEEIVITRHGQPAVKLSRAVRRRPTPEEWARIWAEIDARNAEWVKAHPEAAKPIPWAELKKMMRDEEHDDE